MHRPLRQVRNPKHEPIEIEPTTADVEIAVRAIVEMRQHHTDPELERATSYASGIEETPAGAFSEILLKRLAQFAPCIAMGRIIIGGIPSHLHADVSQVLCGEANDGAESISSPVINALARAVQQLLAAKRHASVLVARCLKRTSGNPGFAILSAYDPTLWDTPQHDVCGMNLVMIVRFHAPVSIPRRGARDRTTHLPA